MWLGFTHAVPVSIYFLFLFFFFRLFARSMAMWAVMNHLNKITPDADSGEGPLSREPTVLFRNMILSSRHPSAKTNNVGD